MVSIVIPARNASSYILETLDSIIAQSYENWEAIIIDDHSTDNTFDLVNNRASDEPRLQIHRNHGKGIIDALNQAYRLSKGSYITRMDADDLMTPERLRLMRDTFNDSGSHVAVGLVKYFSENQLGDGYQKYEQWLNNLTLKGINYSEIYKECVIPSPCWMMERSVFDQIGGFKASVYPEDYDLCFRMYKHQVPIKSIPEVLLHWRDHGERASRNDENYADNTFLNIKLKYFLDLELKPHKHLILWGAGKRGKRIANVLSDANIELKWVTNNRDKIGHFIHGIELTAIPDEFDSSTQIIIAVSGPDDQDEIKKTLSKQPEIETFWFV